MTKDIDYKNIFYPPGGILIWIIIVVEVLTFAMALLTYCFQRMQNLELFNSSQEMLSVPMGTANTIILLTSGFLMAEAIHILKKGDKHKSCLLLLGTIFLGALFLILKSWEFNSKIAQGIGLEHNLFFTFYWLLTGFHFLHVVVGLVILAVLFLKIRNGQYSKENYLDVETGGAFWHMCDMIWLLLFPVLYLLH